MNKVVLAYSGGLDTSVAVAWLREQHRADVVTLTVDVGGGSLREGVERRALSAGARRAYVVDARERFVTGFVWPHLQANALYQGVYPLATALARPLIAQLLVEVAQREGADAVAHGCTGKGNDQVRFDVAVRALDPGLTVVAPMRVGMGLSREEEIDYARERGIEVPVTKESPYSIDANMWGRSIEAGVLEDPWTRPPADVWDWTVDPAAAPDPAEVTIGLEGGVPTTLDGEHVREILELSYEAGELLTVVLPCRDVFRPAAHLNHLAELPVLEYKKRAPSSFTIVLKRAIDIAVSSAALVMLLPLFVVIAVAIKLDSRGPVFFSQVRAGAGGSPFRMFKFRSMVVHAEELLENLISVERLPEPVFKLHDDPRVTRLGLILRRWSLDELPQLWNVLFGHMSLVGPRPEELELVDRYAPEHRSRLAVKPGITGPMQVHGRGELTFAERLAVERDYIEDISIVRDLRIMAMTVPAVLSGKGAY